MSINGDTDEYVVLDSGEKKLLGGRGFVGELRCELLSMSKDTQSGITTIDARVTELSKAWAER